MSRRVSDRLGKLLIITSFILFAIAAYMSNIVNHQYDSEGRLVAGSGNLFITIRPEDELTAEEVNDNNATGGEKKPDNTSETDNPNAGENDNSSNNGASGGNNENSTNNGGDIGGGSTPVNPSTPDTPVTPEPPAIDPSVINLRNSLQSRYGIPIRLSVEVSDYSVGGYSTTPVTDTGELLRALYSLDNDLSKYPSGLFYELTSSKPLNIYLIKNYSNNSITGVTDHYSNPTVISVATDKDFDVTLHHEMFHYMERYITGRGANFNESEWNTRFNPEGFNYVGSNTGAINDSLSYTKNGGRVDSWFVNRYAQTSAAEDRASTFEYMMADNKAACLNYDMPVYRKARYMADQLDYFTNSCSSGTVEYWERFL